MTVAVAARTQKPVESLAYDDFKVTFNFTETTTEMSHPITEHLSEVMKENPLQGLELLLKVDEMVLEGYEQFIPQIHSLSDTLSSKIARGGRIFLLGSGSSGRVGTVLSKLTKSAFKEQAEVIHALLSGGDSVMIKPKENHEDNAKAGSMAFEEYDLGVEDTVFLISASGSATFNAGAGHAAAEAGADVYYFYNSTSVPDVTKALFNRQKNPVHKLCLDIGPQAIAGSTRLQAATLANAALGALLVSTLYKVDQQKQAAAEFPNKLLENMRKGFELIRAHSHQIAEIALLEKAIFSHPASNFMARPGNPKAAVGYVTFVADEHTIQTVFIDATESSPTFSLPPMLRENEVHKLLPAYAAYLVGAKNNHEAWEKLLGRRVHKEDLEATESFLLSKTAPGIYSYENRPTREGNLVFGVAKIAPDQQVPAAISGALLSAKRTGAKTCLILLSQKELAEAEKCTLSAYCDVLLSFDNLPEDPTGFSETILLKQVLNLISNSAMTLVGKVEGNLMTDVRAANNKLIARVMTLIKKRWDINRQTPFPLPDEKLYKMILKRMEEKKGDLTDTIPIVKDIYDRIN